MYGEALGVTNGISRIAELGLTYEVGPALEFTLGFHDKVEPGLRMNDKV